jgi:hypothetical protein
MNATVYPSDPWGGVLEHLEEATSLNRESNKWKGSRLAQFLHEVTGANYRWQVSAAPAAPGERTDGQKRQRFRVVERSDERDIIISWQDPTRGHVGEQRWRFGTASTSGICALSGRPIRRGDFVFRPMRPTSRRPEFGDMILAAAIDSAYEYRGSKIRKLSIGSTRS